MGSVPVVSAVCMVWHPAVATAMTATSAAEVSRREERMVVILAVGRIVIAANTRHCSAGRAVAAGLVRNRPLTLMSG
jgi:hypothetical protein